ncbi:MAG: DEAD/DEAH box helicase [Candidatus Cloacimonadaceae bacterium]|nr:DEAD/DEAH box helicase [Candidatus Cloacimonadota bacterium]MCK9241782.1 DEAD/DEAH box helicase [Candidatus Cloacimonadota bacterium]MDY0126870.1 DEAD/DEAH box helicase [Candidatus Cloacimonadaceae bacterium]
MTKFTDITLPEPIQRAAKKLGYESPTAIQESCIPWILDNDQDLIALANTGTGKTAAFGFPLLSEIDVELSETQSIILCPTRELCLQITKDIQAYAFYMTRIRTLAVYGGAPIYKQKEALRTGAHIVVGTPGRVADMIRQKALNLENVTYLVLDEADEMLNMGFHDELTEIMESIPQEKQTLLFSATMPKEVENLANKFMKEPHRISEGSENKGAENIQHFYYRVQARDKYLALKRIVDMNPSIYGIIFCRTRKETQEIADKLQHDGYNADALHGDLSQGQRELVMSKFHSKFVPLLVATDVAARGLDVDDLTHIINFQVPTDPIMYIHRCGRTGRAGKSGISITITHSKEGSALKAVEKLLGAPIVWQKVPGGREICEKQLFHFIDTVERIEVNEAEMESFLTNVFKKLSWMTREELIKRFVSVEFNRFLNYYKDIPDLDNMAESQQRKDKSSFSFSTFRLNIGDNLGLTKRELMRYINGLRVTRGIEIGRINIFSDYCLIDLDARYEAELKKAITKNPYKGQSIKPSVSQAKSAPAGSYSKDYGKKRRAPHNPPWQGKKKGKTEHYKDKSRPGAKSDRSSGFKRKSKEKA